MSVWLTPIFVLLTPAHLSIALRRPGAEEPTVKEASASGLDRMSANLLEAKVNASWAAIATDVVNQFALGKNGDAFCTTGALTEDECRTAAGSMGLYFRRLRERTDRPHGCYMGIQGNANYNPIYGVGFEDARPICWGAYTFGKKGTNRCPEGRLSKARCRKASRMLGLFYNGVKRNTHRPGACFEGIEGSANFNPLEGKAFPNRRPICTRTNGWDNGDPWWACGRLETPEGLNLIGCTLCGQPAELPFPTTHPGWDCGTYEADGCYHWGCISEEPWPTIWDHIAFGEPPPEALAFLSATVQAVAEEANHSSSTGF